MRRLVTRVNGIISFPCSFSPPSYFEDPIPESVYLFIQDPQDVDDIFKMPYFGAKAFSEDPQRLDILDWVDVAALGLDVIGRSIRVETWKGHPTVTTWQKLNFFHEILGFPFDALG